ncbi:hypothetical protein B857_02009 [Solibacillus isronensis B3W22]|uniref:Uncharacterized protein n=1 Tax=Solibacillus isronensis B3W22 TaxID=1224748 RepID=K1KLX1_9BACL|nr:hypothetical protein [Solibacillus isronensis]AMO86549.1 hypothetical protein SOLI23_13565 [Solibacillus silvestris]EKB45130.1 hypothetical protein B857_02009 [Solibacillus isronensis B3W22]
MKKYWQLLLIAGIIVVTFTVHYIQVVNAKDKEYDFTFEKISGDDKYIDSLMFETSVEYGIGYNLLLISKDESTLIESIHNRTVPIRFQRLIDEHKSFMRGKAFIENNYFEDDMKLIYMNEPEEGWKIKEGDTYSYEVDILDKVKDEKTSFTIESQLKNRYNWVFYNDITVIDNELKLIVKQMDNDGSEKMYQVIIDLKKQQLLSETLLEEATTDDTTRRSIDSYNSYSNLGHEKYHVYSINSFDLKSPEQDIFSRQFSALNTETNEITDIQLPEGLDQNMQSIEVDDNYLVIAYSTKEEIVIYRYNIGQQRWLEPITVPYSEKVLIPELNSTATLNGKFYVMTEVNSDFILKIFDIEQGTLLYEGKLINNNVEQKYYIHITDVYELEK